VELAKENSKELSEETKKRIGKARNEIKAGKTMTTKQLITELGI
jgi:hypothetical protein